MGHGCAAEGARNRKNFYRPALVVLKPMVREAFSPKHGEVGLDHLLRTREVEPDLKEFGGIAAILMDEGKHLSMHDPSSRRHPLRIPGPEAGGGPERIAVIDETLLSHGDGLEPSVGMLRKSGHRCPVIHRPPLFRAEIHPQLPVSKRGVRAHGSIAHRVEVAVVSAKQKGVVRLKRERQGLDTNFRGSRLGFAKASHTPSFFLRRESDGYPLTRQRFVPPPTRAQSSSPLAGLQVRPRSPDSEFVFARGLEVRSRPRGLKMVAPFRTNADASSRFTE